MIINNMLSLSIVQLLCLTAFLKAQPPPISNHHHGLNLGSSSQGDVPDAGPDDPPQNTSDMIYPDRPMLSPAASSFSDCESLPPDSPTSPTRQDPETSISNIFSSLYPSDTVPKKLLPLPSPKSIPKPILPTSPLYRRAPAKEKVICTILLKLHVKNRK